MAVSLRENRSQNVVRRCTLPSTLQVAYILNIRGNDVAHSPVAIAYLLVTESEAKVFIDKAKMSTEVEAEMKVNA